MTGLILRFVFMIVIPNICANNDLQNNPNHFGPYTCTLSEYHLCKGPKAKNLTNFAVKYVKEGQEFVGYYNLTFLVQSQIEEIKIVVYTLKGNTRNILWSYNLKDPCQHFLFASLIETHLNAHNCVINKGTYVPKASLSEVIRKFLGPSFFYGQYFLKAMVMSKKGNIFCLAITIDVLKKIKEK